MDDNVPTLETDVTIATNEGFTKGAAQTDAILQQECDEFRGGSRLLKGGVPFLELQLNLAVS